MDWQQLTSWDWFIGISLLVSVGLGLWNGLLKTVFHLAAWVAAFVAALVGPGWIGLEPTAVWNQWWLPVLLFIAVFAVTRLVGHFAARGLVKLGLAPVDRMAGGLFGLARALLILALVVGGAKMLQWHQTDAWQKALSRPLLDEVLAIVEPWLPDVTRGIKRT